MGLVPVGVVTDFLIYQFWVMDDLFEKMISGENINLAYEKAINNKRIRPDILKFSFSREKNLAEIEYKLKNKSFVHSPYFSFVVNDSKKRIIWAAQFPDRIVHHILCNILNPIFEKTFIHDSYACREGKGVQKAVRRCQQFIRVASGGGKSKEKTVYCFKGDIRKYFDNIDRQTLKEIIRKKIESPGLLWLIDLIIDSHVGEKGMPIGNLTSQLFANIYLNELDHFMKDRLKVKCYIRYMDDFVILDTDKEKLFCLRDLVKNFLNEKLKLKLHPKKSEYFPIIKGIDFLGYTVFWNYITLRKSTLKRFEKRLKKQWKKAKDSEKLEVLDDAFISWMSYYRHARCNRIITNMYERYWWIIWNNRPKK